MKIKKKFFIFHNKMADLFDINVGGLGFHLTAHMIALAALFVACFAITGYITFRDESIPDSALEPGADNMDIFTQRVAIPVSAAGVFKKQLTFTQPANTFIRSLDMVCTQTFADAVDAVEYSSGTAVDGVDILALQEFGATGKSTGAVEFNTVLGNVSYSTIERTIHVNVQSPPTGTVTIAGSIDVVVQFLKL